MLENTVYADRSSYQVASVAYSEDGQVLTAIEVTYSNGVPQQQVVIWRTSDWQRLGTIDPGQTRAEISWDPQTKLVAERTDGGSVLSLRTVNGDVLHTVKFDGNVGNLKQGYTFRPSYAFGGGGFLTTPSGEVITMSSNSLSSSSTHPSGNGMLFDYSPDGLYIAAGYHFGAVWIWKLP